MIHKKSIFLFSILAFVLIVSPGILGAESHYTYIHSPKSDVYFGYITYTEVQHDGKDPVVIREGEEAPRVAVLNFPLLPGDTIRTTAGRRCEVQLDTGTIIRLDLDTELKIETIMAKSLSTVRKVTNFLLNRGQVYIMYKRYSYPEIFQVITPNASVKLNHNAVAMIAARDDGSSEIQVRLGKAFVLYGPDGDSLKEEVLKKSESLTVSKSHRALLGEYKQDADFELWNDSINKNFKELHRGIAVIPEPIHRYSPAVIYFAQKYSSIYGEWVWDDLYGYVWRPYFNDYYPNGSWSPYYYGQWREADGQLFWVAEEPWGWVPYHLGLWVWNKNRGWLWIPGSAFAPAWVDWGFHMGYYGWRPWSMWDWYFYGMYYNFYPYYYYSEPFLYDMLYDPLADNPQNEGIEWNSVKYKISKAQLKKPSSLYPVPKELKGTYKKVVSALKAGDSGILASLRKNIEQAVFVKKEDLNAARIQKGAILFRELPQSALKNAQPQRTVVNPYREAVKAYRENEARAFTKMNTSPALSGIKGREGAAPSNAVPSKAARRIDPARNTSSERAVGIRKRDARLVPSTAGKKGKSAAITSREPFAPVRFRDWNPDAIVARRAGVSLKYSSRSNQIECPELALTSRTVRRSTNMVSMTGVSPSGGGSYYSGSDRGHSSSSSSSSRGTQSSSSRSSGAGSKSTGSRGNSEKK
ncbi:MAG: FecR family protein [Candidatus Aminicenantes bacterium]|nr:FecR family protein [Candidatus Aminicenantes bacterium]